MNSLTRYFLVLVVAFLLMLAMPLPACGEGVAGDIDGSLTIDAVDVQFVINAALELPVAFSTDIDHSGGTTAVDVQLVINGALGLVIDGKVLGWITDETANALPFVEVTVLGAKAAFSVYSDAAGLYTISVATPPQSPVTLAFTREGYASNSRQVTVPLGGSTTVNVAMMQLADPVVLPAAENGGSVADVAGNRITFSAGSLVGANKAPVEGAVDVQITPINIGSSQELAAFPGDFRAVPAVRKNGETVQLETFALADFTVSQSSEELALGGKATAGIELILPEDTPLTNGEGVPMWSFDTQTGLWIEEGNGVVGPSTAKVDRLAWFATIPHLSWWNCDKPISTKHCLQGRVVDGEGNPVQGAQVIGKGITYNGSSYAVTDTQGHYCMDVMKGSQVQVSVTLPGGNLVIDFENVTVPDIVAVCPSELCTQVPDLVTAFDACVSGIVQAADGRPLSGISVRSSFGSTAVTDANGAYCMDAPGGVEVTIYVLGRPPVTVTPVAPSSCAEGNCVEANIDIDFPKDGDRVGLVMAELMEMTVITTKTNQPSLSTNAWFFSSDMTGGIDFDTITQDLVYVTDVQQMYGGPEGRNGSPWATEPPVGALDPGSPGEGRDESNQATLPVRLIRQAEFFQPIKGMPLTPTMFGTFMQDPWSAIGFAYNDVLSYSWPGGIDIGAFTGLVTAPDMLVLTSPQIVQGQYQGAFTSIDFSKDLEVLWDATNPGSFVHVVVSRQYWNSQTQQNVYGAVVGILVDDGQATIAKSFLDQLPSSQDQHVWGNFQAARYNADEILAPLAHVNGSGIVDLLAGSKIQAAIQYPPEIVSFAINNGDEQTTSRDVSLQIQTSNEPSEFMASESPTFDGAVWQYYYLGYPLGFQLSSGNGEKTVYVKVRNGVGESTPASDTIVLNEIVITVVFDNGNIYAVDNNPSNPTVFTVATDTLISKIVDYHWNYGSGATPGTIGLQQNGGPLYGPWQAIGLPGQGNVPNAYWECVPNIIIPAGTYTVVDSDPATWAQNFWSDYRGMTSITTITK